MKKAQFALTGMMGATSMDFEGETWNDIAKELNAEQDLFCLASQIQMMGTPSDRKKVSSLIDFLSKYENHTLTREDIEKFNLRLSIGQIKCVAVADDEDETPKANKRTRKSKG